jgi:hypothetical protein
LDKADKLLEADEDKKVIEAYKSFLESEEPSVNSVEYVSL